ncbi:P-loop containing nucleoside triphosphate hydrolase protein [Mycena floridula]|nr:P-loop containing nucleoside triphosphate hydrolase protein [Mycena floridula]
MNLPLLSISDLSCVRDSGIPIFSGLTLTVNDGDVVCIQGTSGSGKTTLLKCLAHLNVCQGTVLFHGRPPVSFGVPQYRTKVAYVPQRPSILPGTPHDFLLAVSGLSARQSRRNIDLQNPIEVAVSWGIESPLWDRDWTTLSGGECQRIALAIAVGLDTAEILLLDEPTSALDPSSSLLVEQYLLATLAASDTSLKAILWITHSVEQAGRVGTRFFQVDGNGGLETPRLPPV